MFADRALADWAACLPPDDDGELDVSATRARHAAKAAVAPKEPELPDVRELDVNGLRARLYRPSDGPTPLVLYLHGGGWTIGSIDTHDQLARTLASRSGVSVLSLDYRLAPEHPWPASVDDTVAALEWIAAGQPQLGPIGRVAVAGDSAGGTLATLACLRLRDHPHDALPDLQVLVYANTDLSGSQPSIQEKGAGFGLSAAAIRFFNRQWVPDRARWTAPDVSPLHAPDLHGLPPALVITAEHDPLRDEGERYADRLRAAGVSVYCRREDGLVHSFMLLDQVSPACAAATGRVADDLRRLLTA